MSRNDLRRTDVHFNNYLGIPKCYKRFFEDEVFAFSTQVQDPDEEESENDSSSPIRKVEINPDNHFGIPKCETSFFENHENDNSE